MLVKLISLCLLLALTISCSTETNLNQFFASDKNKESLDNLLAQAQLAYDQGDYGEALDFALDAQAINSGSEDVAILLGYVYLALGGMDSFALADGLIAAGKNKTSSNGTTSILEKMRTVIGLTSDSILKLGSLEQADSSYPLFANLDVIIPKGVTEARAGDLSVVVNANNAIAAVCPFVNSAALNSEDSRHSAANCPPTTNSRYSSSKAHFLWAFAHLSEAIAFNSAVLYQESGQTKSNLERRVDALGDTSTVGVTSYVSHITKLSSNIDSILAFENSDSQLRAMYNSLVTTSLAFAQMPGVPSKVTKSITKAIASIQEKQNSIGSSTSDGTQALKSELTESLSENLSSQISSLASSNPSEFASNKTEICSSYTSISAGAALPSECN